MALAELYSLSYPKDSASQKLFHSKCFRFFSYSISNMLSLIYGGFLISLVLYVQEVETNVIVIYFLTTALVALTVFALSIYVEKRKPTGLKLQKILMLRVFLGCCIGVMYGISCFLLPQEATESGILFLVFVYFISISVAIFQYSVIPLYYIMFMFSVYVPLFIYIIFNNNHNNLLMFLFIVSSMCIFIFKGIKVSTNVVDSIVLNIGLKKEVEEHLKTQDKLHLMAMYDDLTQIANRHNFKENSEAILDRAKKTGSSMTIVYIDLNNFKEINDSLGHFVGDQVLIKTAEIIRSKVRTSDLVARLGGDEFVIILENYDRANVKGSLLKDIDRSLNKKIDVHGHKINLSASIGIAGYPEDGASVEEVLHAADTGMYQNKQITRQNRDGAAKSSGMR